MRTFDIAIIGAGPGGYVAAIRAAQLGLKTALIEQSPAPGGTCLHRGCIPTKALLHAAGLLGRLAHAAEEGLAIGSAAVDLAALMKRKNQVVRRLAGGVAALLKKNGVAYINGKGALLGGGRLQVTSAAGKEDLGAERIVVATGSTPSALPHVPFDGVSIVSSDEAIAFDAAPERLLVVGAGAVGLELGFVWSRFGSKVTIVELMPQVLPGGDEELSVELAKALAQQGIRILTQTTLAAAAAGPAGVAVKLQPASGAAIEETFTKVLVAVGRRAFLEGAGLEEAGVAVEKGRIPVDPWGRTNAPGIFAIGDVTPGPQLAHRASAQGLAAAETAAGRAVAPVNAGAVPACTYTDPEAASVGLTEKEARKRGLDITVARFPFAASGKAMIERAQTGWVKLIADRAHGQVLGAHIIGPCATELIAEATLAVQLECTCEELARTVHAHPTLSEAIAEAAHAGLGAAIHF
ncbi:MAG TPA: dihydrolipoyl dehydrogenase [Planctomycetota bacterium]|nr:dihydrolipoyl dehydrogenase [Planctomycetota bacterium]OQC22286.1 MAG: Dihydrolipoyl dehydrogenase [Planctomycetes bacterium ADurb.Bin069]NMD35412.1 dihydrolipoyl dehydrogenase [Planctomycetota bacterium]HNS00511.1 dihydrolipoyl dehydrogenase [Planctomycetota bacterium]HNU25879.1 dihydrolipoyl dehydrogenase [Planctomycetota bacterium]